MAGLGRLLGWAGASASARISRVDLRTFTLLLRALRHLRVPETAEFSFGGGLRRVVRGGRRLRRGQVLCLTAFDL